MLLWQNSETHRETSNALQLLETLYLLNILLVVDNKAVNAHVEDIQLMLLYQCTRGRYSTDVTLSMHTWKNLIDAILSMHTWNPIFTST